MPSIRIGFSTDFNLVNEQVGIGTTLPTARLDVRGQIRADNSAGSGGISTLTTYDGFLHSQQAIRNNISIAETTKGNLNSISGEIVIGAEVTVAAGTSIGAGRLDSLTVTSSFDLPTGGSANREVTPEKGSTRFNQDLGQLEFYTGYEWRTVSSYDGSGRGRGVFAGGGAPSIANNVSTNIDYVNISTTGNAINFGNLTTLNRHPAGCSSEVRGIVYLGYISPGLTTTNIIEYITIASEGNSIDFGDKTADSAYGAGSCSSSTRGLFAGGFRFTPNTRVNTIEYIQISTLGNTLDFGDLTSARQDSQGALSSSTRGLFAGGNTAPGTHTSAIDVVTISSTGNATSFGSLTVARGDITGCSNGTRGIFGGGYFYVSPTSFVHYNVSEYITIASNGNATYFGDLSFSGGYKAATSSKIRGVFAGGSSASPTTYNNVINYVNIATTGNALDFGDLTIGRFNIAAVSDSHGGLGGF